MSNVEKKLFNQTISSKIGKVNINFEGKNTKHVKEVWLEWDGDEFKIKK